ncbi:hypothetical protein OG564_10825 [Streptomyces sp. NBC_01280]|uniref:hypothetical protein n=1 Tax=Streptomyces sp. NBC_01280 TaxID=2903810 RepID=UPI002E2FA021|nr:hypothetical protein [Streptomyces sp. NBC_01280]
MDLFGELQYTDPSIPPEPPPLPVFTGASLPGHLRTRKQIRQEGLEPVGRPAGLLSWTPQGYNAPIERPVWDIRSAQRPDPCQPDLIELVEQEKCHQRGPRRRTT